MIVIEFEMDYEDSILRVNSWYYITYDKSKKLQQELNKDNANKNIKIFNHKDIPVNFYKYSQEYFLDEYKLRRFYKKKPI